MYLLGKSTRPYLRIRRPSPTTAEFIVSSHPPPTLRLRVLYAALLAARFLLAVTCVLVLHLNLFPTATHHHHHRHNHHHHHHIGGGHGGISSRTAHEDLLVGKHQTDTLHPRLQHHHHHHHHVDGNDCDDISFYPLLLVHHAQALIHTLALSTPLTRHLARLAPTLSPWLVVSCAIAAIWLASLRTRTAESLLVLRGLGVQVQGRFIPTAKILDVLINEAFLGFEVRYYLAVIVEGEQDVVVVFPTLLPGRDVVEAVWRGVRGCLWEGDLVRRAGVDDK